MLLPIIFRHGRNLMNQTSRLRCEYPVLRTPGVLHVRGLKSIKRRQKSEEKFQQSSHHDVIPMEKKYETNVQQALQQSHKIYLEDKYFREQLTNASSPALIMGQYKDQFQDLTDLEVLDCLHQIKEHCMERPKDIQEIRASEGFLELLKKFYKIAPRLDGVDLVGACQFFNFVRVPPNSKLFFGVVQLIRCHLDSLSLRSLLAMQAILEKSHLQPDEERHMELNAFFSSVEEGLMQKIFTHLPNLLVSSSNLTTFDFSSLLWLCKKRNKKLHVGFILENIEKREPSLSFLSACSLLMSLISCEKTLNVDHRFNDDHFHSRLVIIAQCLETLVEDFQDSVPVQKFIYLLFALKEVDTSRLKDRNKLENLLAKISTHCLTQYEKWNLHQLSQFVELMMSMHYVDERVVAKFIVEVNKAGPGHKSTILSKANVTALSRAILCAKSGRQKNENCLQGMRDEEVFNALDVLCEKVNIIGESLLYPLAIINLCLLRYENPTLRRLLQDDSQVKELLSKVSNPSTLQYMRPYFNKMKLDGNTLGMLFEKHLGPPDFSNMIPPRFPIWVMEVIDDVLGSEHVLFSVYSTSTGIMIDNLIVLNESGHMVKMDSLTSKDQLDSSGKEPQQLNHESEEKRLVILEDLDIPPAYQKIALFISPLFWNLPPHDLPTYQTYTYKSLLENEGFIFSVAELKQKCYDSDEECLMESLRNAGVKNTLPYDC